MKTLEFSLTKKEFFRLSLWHHYLHRQWVYLIAYPSIIFFSVSLLVIQTNVTLAIFGLCLAIFTPTYLIIYYWRYAHDEKNKWITKPLIYQIDAQRVTWKSPTGISGEIPWKHIIQKRETSNYYLLYVSKNQFLYIRKDKFQSKEDRADFLEWMKAAL